MSDRERIRGLGGIKPSRMPVSASQEITVSEAERRLGIAPEPARGRDSDQPVPVPPEDLPESLRNRRPKPLTVSRSFRLPLGLVDELEKVARIHDIPMVTILAEALELHLARFPRQKQG